MTNGSLKNAAAKNDARLNAAIYQTLVHGDAKLANFCFSNDSTVNVAAVDFQYVGGGCGMKDVAYFISSCLNERESKKHQDELLDYYFASLQQSLLNAHPNMEFDSVEEEWRELYPFAWADFCRFLAGWSPGHWKLNKHNDKLTRAAIEQLN